MSIEHLPREFRDAAPLPAEKALSQTERAIFAFEALVRCKSASERYRAAKEGPVLADPYCSEGCDECYLRCATSMIGVKMWEDELALVGGPSQFGRA